MQDGKYGVKVFYQSGRSETFWSDTEARRDRQYNLFKQESNKLVKRVKKVKRK